jgi:hypothetical protein
MRRSLISRACLLAVLLAIAVSTMAHTPYGRTLSRQWIDEDGDCQDARVETLVCDAEAESVRFKNERQRDVDVELDWWPDPYPGNIVTIPTGLDVDHMVPLKGRARERRARVERRASACIRQRSALPLAPTRGVGVRECLPKADRAPDKWKPGTRAVWCQYAQAWASIKFTCGLRSTAGER